MRWLWLPLLALIVLLASHGGQSGTHPAEPIAGALARPASSPGPSGPIGYAVGAPTARQSQRGLVLDGVSLPGVGAGNVPLPPLRLLLVVSSPSLSLDSGDFSALEGWIARHERAESQLRLLVTNGSSARLTSPFSPSTEGLRPPLRSGSMRQAQNWVRHDGSTTGLLRLALAVGRPPAALSVPDVHTGSVTLENGAPVPSATLADPRRRHAVTAALALQILSAAHQTETDPPHLIKNTP